MIKLAELLLELSALDIPEELTAADPPAPDLFYPPSFLTMPISLTRAADPGDPVPLLTFFPMVLWLILVGLPPMRGEL